MKLNNKATRHYYILILKYIRTWRFEDEKLKKERAGEQNVEIRKRGNIAFKNSTKKFMCFSVYLIAIFVIFGKITRTFNKT